MAQGPRLTRSRLHLDQPYRHTLTHRHIDFVFHSQSNQANCAHHHHDVDLANHCGAHFPVTATLTLTVPTSQAPIQRALPTNALTPKPYATTPSATGSSTGYASYHRFPGTPHQTPTTNNLQLLFAMHGLTQHHPQTCHTNIASATTRGSSYNTTLNYDARYVFHHTKARRTNQFAV